MINIYIKNLDKTISFEENEEQSLMEALKENNINIQANCEGNGVCGKCHVILDKNTYKKLPPQEDEEDCLDGLMSSSATSRLACKIKMVQELDGATIQIENLLQ